jgi:hypothetical protein
MGRRNFLTCISLSLSLSLMAKLTLMYYFISYKVFFLFWEELQQKNYNGPLWEELQLDHLREEFATDSLVGVWQKWV